MSKIRAMFLGLSLAVAVNFGGYTGAEAEEVGQKAIAKSLSQNLLLTDAIAAAKKDQKYVLISFSTDGCKRCDDLNQSVFKDKIIGKYLSERFVTLKANTSKSEDASELARENGVLTFPTTLVFNSDGKEVGRLSNFDGAWDYLTNVDYLRLAEQ